MRQLYRAHAVLFVCAYVVFLGYFGVRDTHDSGATLLSRVADLFQFGSAVRPKADERPEPSRAEAPPSIARSSANSADEKAAVTEAVSSAASSEDSAQQERARLSQIGLQATRAEEPQKRAEAIDQLDAATPETLQALQTVVTSDSAVRNRIRAVNSLRLLAEREGAHDAVISILHLAMVDANSSVASRANEVYREITEERAPAE